MAEINDIAKNYKYAPGIATYGPAGKVGATGMNGNSCFYCNYNISNEADSANYKILHNKLLSKYKDVSLSRAYQAGDVIVDCTGGIYKIYADGSVLKADSTSKVGDFYRDSDSSFFAFSEKNGRMYNAKGNGVDIIKTSAENVQDALASDSSYVLRLFNDTIDAESNYNIESCLVQNSDKLNYISTFFNKNDQCFHIETDMPIVLDCSYLSVRDSDASAQTIDNYSQVTPDKENMSKLYNLYKKVEYTQTDSSVCIDISALEKAYYPNAVILNVVSNDTSAMSRTSVPLPWETSSFADSSFWTKAPADGSLSSISFIKSIEVHITKK